MPQVPVAVDNTVQLRPTTGARFEPTQQNAVSEAIGKGLQQVGGRLEERAQAQVQIDTTFAEARAKDADNQFAKHATEQGFGENGYYTTENANTLNARSGYEKALRDKRDQLVNGAQNGLERKMLASALDRRLNSELEGSARYAVGQAKNYWTLQSNSRVANARDDFARYVDDPERSGTALATIQSEVSQQAAHLGLQDAGIIKQMQFTEASKAYGAAIEAKAVNDPVAAALMLDKHREKIDEGTQLNLDRQLHPKLVDHDASIVANAVQAVATPGQVVNNVNGQPTILQLPIKGSTISGFGTRTDPITGGKKFHKGVDIPAPAGTPVGAAGDGKVVFAGFKPNGYGNQVLIEHPDGTQTRYAHMQSTNVHAGDRVGRGAQIGAVGSTGRSTGSHMHFEVIKNGQAVDPKSMVGKAVGTAGQPPAGQPEVDLGLQTQAAKAYIAQHFADRPQAYRDELYEATQGKIVHDFSMAKQIKSDREEREGDQAWRTVDAMGDKFTSVGQIPNYANLSPSSQHGFRVIAKNHIDAAQGGETIKTDWHKYSGIIDAYHSDPKSIMGVRPEQVRPFLGNTEFKEFMRLRGDAIDDVRTGGQGKTPKFQNSVDLMEASKSTINSVIESHGLLTGNSKEAQKNAKAIHQINQKLQDWSEVYYRNNQKWPDSKAIQAHTDALFLNQAGTGTPFYESGMLVPEAVVPQDFVRRYRAANPQGSKDDMQAAYTDALLRGLTK